MDDELYVVISRTPSDYICSEVPISEIEGVMWDNISGGVKKRAIRLFALWIY